MAQNWQEITISQASASAVSRWRSALDSIKTDRPYEGLSILRQFIITREAGMIPVSAHNLGNALHPEKENFLHHNRHISQSEDINAVVSKDHKNSFQSLYSLSRETLLHLETPQLRTSWRELCDSEARNWWSAWNTTRNIEFLHKILQDTPGSSFQLRASHFLGQILLENRQFTAARIIWEKAQSYAENAAPEDIKEVTPGMMAAYLLYLDILENRGSEKTLQEFLRKYGDEHSFMAGKSAPLGDTLRALWTQSVNSKHPNAEVNETRPQPQPVFFCTSSEILLDEKPEKKLLFRDPMPEDVRASYIPKNTVGLNEYSHEGIYYPQHMVYMPHQERIYARMGTPVTRWPQRGREQMPQGYFIALNLKTQGQLLWTAQPYSPDWSFLGALAADNHYVYTIMLHAQDMNHFYLACLDAANGRISWRIPLFSATPLSVRGLQPEMYISQLKINSENDITISIQNVSCRVNLYSRCVDSIRKKD